MRILANDGLVDEAQKYLKKQGFTVETEKRDEDDLMSEIGSFDALLVRSATKVTRALLEAGVRNGGKLKIVGRGGVGTDNIDLEAAKELGVIVKFAPNGNTNATAEHALGLMFAVARRVPFAHRTLMGGTWHKKRFAGVELFGKTLGIIGCGRIGQALATKAGAIGMKVIGFDLYRSIDAPLTYVDTIPELLAQSDFVSLHCGGKDPVINVEEFKQMKDSAYLINASRGKNVAEDALYEALKTGQIAGAALDCYESEPKREGEPFVNKLQELDNIVMSAHLGASTRNAGIRTGMEIAEVVTGYLKRGEYGNSVNVGETVEEEGTEVYTIFITHEDKPGMFGKFGTLMGEMGVNIRENNSRKLGNQVQTVYMVHAKPTEAVREALASIQGVTRVSI
ncbi:phosphoglycerate dehydrogenase [Pseudodesulfovibrio indicus]|uniref:D-3-phosphoglycerate dehydrogenase n=1 Tax=Pseudodesulfovibrio indicus TaxID=1716143 RepID=A0A126QMY0_9BACT|nr:phosphoglycerate dehydrogenase [Pseudodesulfovibrio indicus]AMK11126.1 hydroxyacid dehydrogenase [Pseudodesulfovibrio indicus]TDT92143.1 D-3-phosphoglycerate dehydrogenase [Pseudodesulfovibrio indicus]